MINLISNNDKIKGCECIFTDTIFLKDGVFNNIIKMDKDLCLTLNK
jgi:hypothetical protein